MTLAVQYRGGPDSGSGELVLVSGVPGRHGMPETATLLADSVTLAPVAGEHYYYVRLTQDDGGMLWSAPVWVTQGVVARQPAVREPGTQRRAAPEERSSPSGMPRP